MMGLHSNAGCDYRMAKSLQPLSFAEAVDEIRPDIIGIDANEPRIDGHSADEMTFFVQKKGDVGAPTFFRTMEACGLRDSLMRGTYARALVDGRCITCSHVINRGKARVRYDFVYLNESIFEDYHHSYDYDGAVAAGSDHAAVIINAELNRTLRNGGSWALFCALWACGTWGRLSPYPSRPGHPMRRRASRRISPEPHPSTFPQALRRYA